MKTKVVSSLTFCLLLSVLVAPVFAAAKERAPRTRETDGTYETDDGKSGTISETTTREKGKTERSGTLTNQDGKTVTRKSTATHDKATGTGTYASTTTGAKGKTATVTATAKKNADGTVTTDGTRTGCAAGPPGTSARKYIVSVTTGPVVASCPAKPSNAAATCSWAGSVPSMYATSGPVSTSHVFIASCDP